MGILKLQNFLKTKRAKIYTWLLRGDTAHIGKNSTVYPSFNRNNIKT